MSGEPQKQPQVTQNLNGSTKLKKLKKHFGLVFSSNDQKLTLELGASRVTFSVCYQLLRSNLFI